MTNRKLPLGLMFLSALLLILALRALGWLFIGGLLGGRAIELGQGLLSLATTMILLASAVGLLRLREWARWLTLAVCSAYFGLMLFNVIVTWSGLRSNWSSLTAMNSIEAIIVLASAWWYLNRKEIRQLFRQPNETR
ncbi:MAG: hypothetical protein B6I35_01830 [Anaerolineaceae bacterium 4572_32.2]|nr:MAG: hypothetical protein B6I35_01830 [Anaerolineaceae bacterium 4572_32.2]HEY71810.1 hypothetical protein [Thermoflexia bacterium]